MHANDAKEKAKTNPSSHNLSPVCLDVTECPHVKFHNAICLCVIEPRRAAVLALVLAPAVVEDHREAAPGREGCSEKQGGGTQEV